MCFHEISKGTKTTFSSFDKRLLTSSCSCFAVEDTGISTGGPALSPASLVSEEIIDDGRILETELISEWGNFLFEPAFVEVFPVTALSTTMLSLLSFISPTFVRPENDSIPSIRVNFMDT